MLATELNAQNWGRRMNACSMYLDAQLYPKMPTAPPKKIRLSARPKLGDLRLEPPE
ncbi:hypothetical protein B0H12DRAFT_1093013 [Mycena haematopus]|nr:hypothetical protein B0H12DRAFT_1164854 [Mycena haematopus]KAJ7271348.1 hypothetical protein B0H12DRAFT_1093013 [Mycena haematopus]